MSKEIEVKYLDVNIKDLRNKLKDIGAKRIHKPFLFKRYIYNLLNDKKGFARVRDEVTKKTITIKTYDESKYANETEIEFTSDINDAKKILDVLGLIPKAYQETIREKWTIDECSEIVIDTVPGIPTYVEIECDNETIIKKISNKLGFDFKNGKFGSFIEQYSDYYGVPSDNFNNGIIKQLTFTSIVDDINSSVIHNLDKLKKIAKLQQKKYKHAKIRTEKYNK
jgi:adenylate cyclase class 2